MSRPPEREPFCREIHVRIEPGRAVGELVDDFHHFRATILHDGERISSVIGEALRIPWATCAGAVDPLRQLVGGPLRPTSREAARLGIAHLQCTHLYDAACLAVARAGRGAGSVVYRALVPDRVGGRTRATLDRDGSPLLTWEVDGLALTGPEPYRDRALAGGNFADWARDALDVETCEAALVLSRACMFSMGRSLALDDSPRAIDVPGTRLGVCHTYSEAQADRSFRIVGSSRRLAGAADARHASLDPRGDRTQIIGREGASG